MGVNTGRMRPRVTAQAKRQWEMGLGGEEPFMMLPTDVGEERRGEERSDEACVYPACVYPGDSLRSSLATLVARTVLIS